MINQLHVVADISITGGGQASASFHLAGNISEQYGKVGLWHRHKDGRSLADGISCDHPLKLFRYAGPAGLFNSYKCLRSMLAAIDSTDAKVVHLHGMWFPMYRIAYQAAKLRDTAVVMSPHGCMTKWDLNRKWLKKQIALAVYQRKILEGVDMFFASARDEAEGIRLLGLVQPIAIVPNGVEIPAVQIMREKSESEEKTLLFMGRIHPTKGLLDLVEAWKHVRRVGWRLRIVGPATTADEISYRKLVVDKISEYGLEREVDLPGMVEGDRKKAEFESADIFISPTYSENFGIVTAEALSYGLPAITTTGAPWGELIDHHCGWWVAPGVDGIAGAIRDALDTAPDELTAMGKSGRELILRKYSWMKIASDCLDAYRWVLDTTHPRPACLYNENR